MQIEARIDVYPLAQTFVISRAAKTRAEVLLVTVQDGPHRGRGEAVPYARYGETPESALAQIERLPQPDPALLPPGAARNALDCALWDLRAKQAGRRVWEVLGRPAPGPVQTAFTLSLGPPEAMEAAARAHAHRPILKVKLGTPDDMPRIEAVRRGAPRARIIVDANEGWSAEVYADLAPHLVHLGVALVEQPLPAGQDGMLAEIARPLPVCAGESCHTSDDLPGLAGRYDMVNVKLDKAGGLTGALALADAARARGMGVMVGCMVATSLAMAPAVIVAQGAEVADLDGPLLLAEDRPHGLRYDARGVHPPEPELWG
ncbi:MAG: dipeptide epimerase [Rubellimicrobium sp.]|nr:dipeptide epimerase [Rubellimicrobium sp.]